MDRVSVKRCTAAFDEAHVGIVSPFSYYPGSGRTDADWKYTRCIRTYSRILYLPISVPVKDGYVDEKTLLESDWATGAVMFCRREVVEDVGWDGSYFLGTEDVDICMRAKKAGWRVVVVPSAIAFHTGESTRTSAATAYYGPRNRLWFARKYRTRRVQFLLTVCTTFLLFRLAAVDLIRGRRPPHSRAAARGFKDGWLLWPNSTEALPEEPFVVKHGL